MKPRPACGSARRRPLRHILADESGSGNARFRNPTLHTHTLYPLIPSDPFGAHLSSLFAGGSNEQLQPRKGNHMANKTNTTTTKAGFTPRKDDKSILQQGQHDTVFCIEASRKNPETLQSFERDNLIDTAKTIVRKEARTQALNFLRGGYWVEIFNDGTKELIAGPFDPDQPEPSYIF
jgi:hypothetical protein